MLSISNLRNLIENELSKISYDNKVQNLYQPFEYVFSLEAKRMRPILLLLSHQLFDDNINKSIHLAIGVEMFHNFTLLHDDIMDEAILRRGKSTVHKKWNNNIAILSGDAMLVKAYQHICMTSKKNLFDILDVFNQTAIAVCEGQQHDMDFEKSTDVTINDYIEMIRKKTAVLLAACLKMGAISAGASISNQEELYQFGINIGIAFQLKDDLLDAFGDSKKFGKKQGGDIIANKKTYLYLKALELANKDQKRELINLYNTKTHDEECKIMTVKKIFNELKIKDKTSGLILNYHELAMKNYSNINSTRKEILLNFSKKLTERIS